jgi:hypothetical protein
MQCVCVCVCGRGGGSSGNAAKRLVGKRCLGPQCGISFANCCMCWLLYSLGLRTQNESWLNPNSCIWPTLKLEAFPLSKAPSVFFWFCFFVYFLSMDVFFALTTFVFFFCFLDFKYYLTTAHPLLHSTSYSLAHLVSFRAVHLKKLEYTWWRLTQQFVRILFPKTVSITLWSTRLCLLVFTSVIFHFANGKFSASIKSFFLSCVCVFCFFEMRPHSVVYKGF